MSSTISPPGSPEFAIGKSQSDAILEHHLDDVVELAEPQDSLSAPPQQQFLSADYPPVRIAEQISVDNQNEALEVLTSHQTSVITSKTPPFERVNSTGVFGKLRKFPVGESFDHNARNFLDVSGNWKIEE
ncbi:hypothetical protein Aduo_015129 [Ancylostoma duodenale]